MAKSQVEVFTTGCAGCEPVVGMVRELAGPGCRVQVRDLRQDPEAVTRAAEYGLTGIPAVVVDGRVAPCCRERSGPTREGLLAAGVGGCS
ncbi:MULTISPECIES: thioredoxin family protein [unclassified Nocardiopsis]|uniref:thioredoxin family protein n=1 Tax=unclassified Nocardiopsis TaxID=2649073 RepID=UPI00135B136E|nr:MULTISPECIES: thioredoxin family protein [unclassified Nocardiopsis]